MLFITIQGVRINIAHIAYYMQNSNGVRFIFVQNTDLVVHRATLEEVDKALNKHGESMAILAAARRAIR